jgi:nucleotide-binding universal stress UspA family protein
MSRELEVMTHDLLAELRQAAEQLVDDSGVRHVPDLNVNVHVAAEPARDALNKAYDRADLLVLGAKHHSLLGSVFSVGRRTAAQARGPVALVPQGTADSAADATGGFLVGVDGSAASAAALRWACEEAARRHMQVLAITVSVSDEPFLPAAQDVEAMRERFPDLPLSYKSAPGDPKSVLAERAVSMEALVVGQHGSGHAAAGLIKRLPSVGSVSRWLGAHPPAPVVVVPAELTRRPM